MGLMKALKGLFSDTKKQHNARNFVEILRTCDKEEAKLVKAKLEKLICRYKIEL